MVEAIFFCEVGVFIGGDVLFQWSGTLSPRLLRDRAESQALLGRASWLARPVDWKPPWILEVMSMPRTVQDILDHADELAERFEDYEPSPTDERDPLVFAELRRAVLSHSDAERSVKDAVKHAREHGYSWAFIGSLIGTSSEAARQRYGLKQGA